MHIIMEHLESIFYVKCLKYKSLLQISDKNQIENHLFYRTVVQIFLI